MQNHKYFARVSINNQMTGHQQVLKHERSVRPILSSHKKKPIVRTIEQLDHHGHVSAIAQLSTEAVSVSQIIRTFGKQFRQIRKQYTDGHEGRCVLGVIMSYYGWDGKCISNAERRLYSAMTALRRAGVSKEQLIEMNDSGATFDEIADFLDNIQNR